MFKLKNVSMQYGGEYSLQNITLNIGKGMNFIIGASGSGKTTLLKIISGMESGFEGEVLYCGKNMKALSESEKGYFYNHVFGFVLQDFYLLEERTVLENILLPQYLNSSGAQSAETIMKTLKIQDLANQKVKLLSGGQKQRVAIARELMKNPQVLIADEPTSALDKTSARTIMEALRTLSKNRMVIVVTHDTSLVTERDRVIELDKGELVSTGKIETVKKTAEFKGNSSYTLPFANAWRNAAIGAKRKIGRFCTAAGALLIAGVLLLISAGSAIGNSGNKEFERLLDNYGENILDISIVGSFISANGTDGSGGNTPNADVTQDISGLYEKYAKDERVQFAVFEQAFNDISVEMGGNKYDIEASGSAPVLTRLLAGDFPKGSEYEVVVPEAFVKQTGKTNDSIIGETIEFSCSVVNWDSGQPVYMSAKITAVVVGVAENSASYEYEGKIYGFTVDDSFFFSKPALDSIRSQANIKNDSINFALRAKKPADLISLKDELNTSGIVPLGQFELVEDMVRLQTQTTELSGGATAIIIALSLTAVIAVSLMATLLRKKEYAIYKISGYKREHLLLLNLCDTILYAMGGILLLFLTSPLLNLITEKMFRFNLLQARMLFTGAGFVLLLSILYYAVSVLPCLKIDLNRELKTGER